MNREPYPAEPRRNLTELEPELRDRIRALDEPVAWKDWSDVVRRGRRSTRRSRQLIVVSLSAVAIAATAIGSLVWPSHGGKHPQPMAVSRPTLVAADGELLIASRTASGTCYRWTKVTTGCDSAPLDAAWTDARLVGRVASPAISEVEIRFTDGTSARPDITWMPWSDDDGVFAYRIPHGKTVAEVTGLDGGQVLRRVTWFSV